MRDLFQFCGIMYVASNQKNYFGAVCMLDRSLLQQLADTKGCDLNIYPSSVKELIIIPVKRRQASQSSLLKFSVSTKTSAS